MLHMVAFILVIVGGINWGIVGLTGLMGNSLNLVALIFSFMPALTNIVYILVGISAVYVFIGHKADCKICGKK